MHTSTNLAHATAYDVTQRCSVSPLFTKPDISKIKSMLNVTSEQLANFIGVSPSLAHGWINGTRKPMGPARKLLLLVERNPQIAEQLKSL